MPQDITNKVKIVTIEMLYPILAICDTYFYRYKTLSADEVQDINTCIATLVDKPLLESNIQNVVGCLRSFKKEGYHKDSMETIIKEFKKHCGSLLND